MVEQNGQGGTEGGQSHGEDGGGEQEQEQSEQETKKKKILKIKEIQNKNEFNRDKFPVCQLLSCINKINIVVGETELSIHWENELGLGGVGWCQEIC